MKVALAGPGGIQGGGGGGDKDQEEGKAFMLRPVKHRIQCVLLPVLGMVLRPPIWTSRKRSVQTPVAGPLVPPSDRWRSQSDSLPGGSSVQHGPLAAHHAALSVCAAPAGVCLILHHGGRWEAREWLTHTWLMSADRRDYFLSREGILPVGPLLAAGGTR